MKYLIVAVLLCSIVFAQLDIPPPPAPPSLGEDVQVDTTESDTEPNETSATVLTFEPLQFTNSYETRFQTLESRFSAVESRLANLETPKQDYTAIITYINLGLILFAFIFIIMSKSPKPNPELVQYIRNAKNKGYDLNLIEQQLINNGYSKKEIKLAMKNA